MPFIQTGLIDGRSTARPKSSTGENFFHFTGVRIRVVGAGELDMILYSPDEINSYALGFFTLASTARTSPLRLSNAIEQRVKLDLRTDAINEIFTVNRIILFAKQFATEEPA